MPKKGADRRQQITRQLMGLPLRGRPSGRRTGTKPGERSIPNEWRDLDKQCLEFALNEMNGESTYEQFVSCAAREARSHEKKGDYKISKLSGKLTHPRKPRTHEQRVRQMAKALVVDARRARLEL